MSTSPRPRTDAPRLARRKPNVLANVRRLRRPQTPSEARLWSRLRDSRLLGAKFRRQHPIGQYIVDFVCLEQKVVIEVDGSQHSEDSAIAHDAERTAWLEGTGYRVLRFWNNDVSGNLDGVLETIRAALGK
ncbi:MAG: endonuclease domain-containing protein [Chloroflexi bacterium]|nr:endonuclease domain-containing protein [Chloroflexota bacterium]